MLSVLRRRLSWRAREGYSVATTNPDRVLMAQCLVYLYGGGSTLGLVSVVFFEARPTVVTPGILATVVGGYLLAGIGIAGFDRISHGTFQVLSACGTALIALAIYFNGDPGNDNELLYLLVALYAFYFFTPLQAALQLALIAAAYGCALLGIGGEAVEPTRYLIALGTLTVAGVMIGLLKRHLQQLIDRLDTAARTDALTGPLNRRGFEQVFDTELERASRGGHALGLIVGDLDRFKSLNDCSGHHAGDEALARFARLLEHAARRIDATARIGGEEFALLLPETSSDGAWRLAERVREEVAEAFASDPVHLTISFGVACYPAHGESAEQLLRAADQALYAAKELGRNRTVAHSPDVAAILVGAAGRRDDQSQGHVATMVSLAEALDIRDSGTAAHAQTVGRYAEGMALRLGLSAARVEHVRLAGILHDIGKIGVPDSILRKPGALDEHEWAVMRKHSETGARILESGSLEDVRDWVLAHHERPDGTGYPYGLPGDRIPIEASIVAVADAYEAMTSDRVYRVGLGPVAAREQLLQGSGSQFEPSVVTAFLELLDAEALKQIEVAHNGPRALHRDDFGYQPSATARGLQRL